MLAAADELDPDSPAAARLEAARELGARVRDAGLDGRLATLAAALGGGRRRPDRHREQEGEHEAKGLRPHGRGLMPAAPADVKHIAGSVVVQFRPPPTRGGAGPPPRSRAAAQAEP